MSTLSCKAQIYQCSQIHRSAFVVNICNSYASQTDSLQKMSDPCRMVHRHLVCPMSPHGITARHYRLWHKGLGQVDVTVAETVSSIKQVKLLHLRKRVVQSKALLCTFPSCLRKLVTLLADLDHQQLGYAKLSHNQMCIWGFTTNTIQACPWRFCSIFHRLCKTQKLFFKYILPIFNELCHL